ncbi:MAG: O-methyltransferase, partial [Alphaproteobacteria bacterium]
DGLVVFDNVLWGGAVVDPSDKTADTLALRELNDFLPTDPRVECVMITVADGLTIARKRGPAEGGER